MSKKLWAGRFTQETHPDVELFTASISFDCELAFEDILGSIAHTKMLAHCKIISDEESEKIQQGLKLIAKEFGAEDSKAKNIFSIADEDIHMNIERLLGEKIGAVAGKLHTARSRNDQVALDIHLYLRKQIILIMDLLLQFQKTFLELAEEHQHIIIPGYTHLQRAQPIYLAQHWLAYAAMLSRDIKRLQEIWQRVNVSPLGACALAGTTFPIDKNYVAQLLGFDGIYANTLDAVSDRDFIIEFLGASALIMMHISRLSEELILWSSQEFNFIQFEDAYCTGSSIMPQKKNPDVAELGRGKTGRVYGALLNLLTLLKGLPLAYNKDLQEDKEPLFDTVKTLRQTIAIYIPLLKTLKINAEAMYQATQTGFLNATVFAEYLVKNGMSFRAAHEVSGKVVAYCNEKKCRLEDLTLQELQQFSPLIKEDVYKILSINNAVAACDSSNEKNASAFKTQFTTQKNQIDSTETWLLAKKALLRQLDFLISED